jgi:hypothetical protein
MLTTSSLRVMDEDVVELGEIGPRQHDVRWAIGEGKMERSDGGGREAGKKLSESSASGGGWFGEVVEMSCVVEKGKGEFEKGKGGRAERGKGRAVGVRENFEEDFGRKVRAIGVS